MGYASDYLCPADGEINNKLNYLYPEEALYLMENVSHFFILLF
jgi:hypothetical protein